jgi:DNA segregation ATPase FtsK/SpoIIIE, S-DNA-T family
MRLTRSTSIPLAGGSTIRHILRRNVGAMVGLAVLALAAVAAASLATWTVDDPSLSHATDHAIRNVLGFPGAIISDLLTQLLGLAASLLLLPPVVWAWRAVFALPTRLARWTAASWIAGTLMAALALSTLPVPHSWPLPTGLGGALGDLLQRIPAFFIGATPAGLSALVTGLVIAVATIALMLHACGLIWPPEAAAADDEAVPAVRPIARVIPTAPEIVEDEEPEEEDLSALMEADYDEAEDDDDRPTRLALMIGLTAHLMLRLIGMVHRLFSHRHDETEAWSPGAFGDARVEPRLGGLDDDPWTNGAAPAPDLTDDGVIEEDFGEPAEITRVSAPAPKPKPGRRAVRETRKATAGHSGFVLPPLALLAQPKVDKKATTVSQAALEQNARLLEGVLDDFGVRGEIVNVRPGPVVTLYELEPAPGIKSARVIGLADDIARSMSAISCRVAVIPGKNAIGIELPNAKRETVYLRELLASQDFEQTKARVGLCLGKTIGGEPVIVDLARMPHLLVAGTTGSGKSVSINTMILSLLYRLTPDECRMIMIDPKMLELSTYDGIPHLLTPVVTDPKQAVVALKWTVREMEDRYRKMSKLGVRNIDGFNLRLAQARTKKETLTRTVQTGFDPDTGEAIYEQEELSLDPMPFIVVVIDEMADLMMVAGKDIEGTVQRLAQMARAAGIHVIMATQRPSVDVITGTIKANFPTRISFQVTSKIDSRTILNEQGAEQLLGQGDMLYMAGGGRIQRVHGPFVSDQEVEEVVAHLKAQGEPEYLHAVTIDEDDEGGGMGGVGGDDAESNDLYDRAVAIVLRDRKASTSYIQRRLSIGYNRAASLIERMEQEGVISRANHAGKREILVPEGEEAHYR